MVISQNKFGRFLKNLLIIVTILIVLIGIGIFGVAKIKSTPKTVTATSKQAQTATDFYLSIPSLNISAPVVADVDGNNKEVYFKALQNGVAQYKGTAKPGEGGNIFIFGHSSYYAWDPGHYKEIFKNLEDIKIGAEIEITYRGKEYKYKVTQTKVVKPTDISSLAPTSSEQLTLMTCVPPGTTTNRLIVVARPE